MLNNEAFCPPSRGDNIVVFSMFLLFSSGATAAVEMLAALVQLMAPKECHRSLSSGVSPPFFVWIYFPFPTRSLAPKYRPANPLQLAWGMKSAGSVPSACRALLVGARKTGSPQRTALPLPLCPCQIALGAVTTETHSLSF